MEQDTKNKEEEQHKAKQPFEYWQLLAANLDLSGAPPLYCESGPRQQASLAVLLIARLANCS
jgi:hypothetical protein